MKSRVPAMQSVGGNPVRSAKIGEIWGLWRSWFRTYSENCSELPASAGRKKNSESPMRSEEHTSELQSHSDLVCRLLLEKKKKSQRNGVRTKKENVARDKGMDES